MKPAKDRQLSQLALNAPGRVRSQGRVTLLLIRYGHTCFPYDQTLQNRDSQP